MTGSLWNDEQLRPLQHIRVIDLTVMLTGPFLTRLLAQYGADVVKVERLPGGDPLRELKDSAIFSFLNSGKRSLALDLSQEIAVGLLKQMVSEADVFIENAREGVMEKLGLGYSDLSEANPDLLYVSLRGFTGKSATRAGHDINFIANSGVGEWFLENGVPNYSTFFGDLMGGAMTPALKILAHLCNPNRRGMQLISSMDEGFRSLYLARGFETVRADLLPQDKREGFGAHRVFDGHFAHSRFYRCRDDQWITLQAVQKKHWDEFCEIVDKKEWKDRQSDPSLVGEVEALFKGGPSTYWETLCAKKEVCLFRVVPWKEHVDLSQARTQLMNDPMTWAGFAPNPSLGSAPELGRDSFTLLNSLGIDHKTVGEWFASGIVFQQK